MAETIELRPAPALRPETRLLGGGVTLRIGEPRAYVRLQLARGHVGNAASIRIRDVQLPIVPNRWAGCDPSVLWTAPDGWLLASATLDGEELREIARAACATSVASVVDVSDALVALEVDGVNACALLARGTGLNLSPTAFGPGQCARTRLAQLVVVVRACANGMIEIIVDRAPAAWLCEWLADAAATLAPAR
jgi:sarcosine oxidase subunit gamma